MEQLDITTAFDRQIRVPAVQDVREMGAVLAETGVFEGSPEGVDAVVRKVAEYTGSERVGVGVKTILTTSETARLSADPAEWFAEQIAGQIARWNYSSGGR
jgi:vesicle-fusing ATPase